MREKYYSCDTFGFRSTASILAKFQNPNDKCNANYKTQDVETTCQTGEWQPAVLISSPGKARINFTTTFAFFHYEGAEETLRLLRHCRASQWQNGVSFPQKRGNLRPSPQLASALSCLAMTGRSVIASEAWQSPSFTTTCFGTIVPRNDGEECHCERSVAIPLQAHT